MVFDGSGSWHMNCPPAGTNEGEHETLLVFAPFILAYSSMPLSGYCCELVTSSIRVVDWPSVFVPSTTSSHASCATKLHEEGAMEYGAMTKK